jgi:hypothetical protein
MPVVPKAPLRTAWFRGEGSGISDDCDAYTESPEAAHVMVCALLTPALLTPALLVRALCAPKRHLSLNHPIQDYEHQVGYRHYGALLPSSRGQLLESSSQHRALLTGCRPCALDQRRTQIGIAMRRLATLLNAGTFATPRTQTGPAR